LGSLFPSHPTIPIFDFCFVFCFFPLLSRLEKKNGFFEKKKTPQLKHHQENDVRKARNEERAHWEAEMKKMEAQHLLEKEAELRRTRLDMEDVRKESVILGPPGPYYCCTTYCFILFFFFFTLFFFFFFGAGAGAGADEADDAGGAARGPDSGEGVCCVGAAGNGQGAGQGAGGSQGGAAAARGGKSRL
jgi:hypothetical protein